MTGKQAYLIWCKAAGIWADFVRPTPFVFFDNWQASDDFLPLPYEVNLDFLPNVNENSALIIDLPSSNSIYYGVELARIGFCPVPLFNGCNPFNGGLAIVDNSQIELKLIECAKALEGIVANESGRPVFLLDSNRLHRHKLNDSVLDNSWDVFPQDFPSPKALKQQNINSFQIYSKKISKDLSRLLKKFSKFSIATHLLSF